MTAELYGTPWKIKMDSYIPGWAIVDLKVVESLTKMKWVRDIGYLDFVRYWGMTSRGDVPGSCISEYRKAIAILHCGN